MVVNGIWFGVMTPSGFNGTCCSSVIVRPLICDGSSDRSFLVDPLSSAIEFSLICDGSSDRSFLVDPLSYVIERSFMCDGSWDRSFLVDPLRSAIEFSLICYGLSDRSFVVDPFSYFTFQLVLHKWCNKSRSMCYPVCGMVHIKVPLLLIEKNSTWGGDSWFPLFTIRLTPYNRT